MTQASPVTDEPCCRPDSNLSALSDHPKWNATSSAQVPLRVTESELFLPSGLTLLSGEVLSKTRIAWRLVEPASDCQSDLPLPCLLILGGISANRRVFTTDREYGSGWWQALAGAGSEITSGRYRVLSVDYIGGNDASTGPDHCPYQDGEIEFPAVSTADQANAVVQLLDHLGIDRLHCLIGASYGGLVGFQFASRYPERLDSLLSLGAAHRPDRHASATRLVQREILRLGLNSGSSLKRAVSCARALAVTSYRSAREFEQRFDTLDDLASYLHHQGDRFADRFSARAYLCLSESIDTHDVNPSRISTPTTLVAFNNDLISPPKVIKDLHRRLPCPGRFHLINSLYGHDGFLKETEAVQRIINQTLTGQQTRDENLQKEPQPCQ